MNSPSQAELKLKFLRDELSRCSTLITEAKLGLSAKDRDQPERLLGHVEVAHGSISTFLSDPERMKYLNEEQQRELRESAEGLRTMLEESRRSLLERKDRPKGPKGFSVPSKTEPRPA